MADNKKMVEAITSMEEDFAQWYTDVVKKAELQDPPLRQPVPMYGAQACGLCNLGTDSEAVG